MIPGCPELLGNPRIINTGKRTGSLASMDDPGKSRVTRESENILIGGVGRSSQASKVDAQILCYE